MAEPTTINTAGSEQKPGKSIDGTGKGSMAQAHKEQEEEQNTKETETPLITKDPAFLQKIRDCSADLDKIKAKRTELTAEKNMVYARFDIDGLNKKAVEQARSYVDMSEDDRENYDISYQVTRLALGRPVQDDLFEAQARKEVEAHGKSKQH